MDYRTALTDVIAQAPGLDVHVYMDLADLLVARVNDAVEAARAPQTHEERVTFTLENETIMELVRNSNNSKIPAIKELRAQIPGLGLKDAKETIEDYRIWDPYHNPPF